MDDMQALMENATIVFDIERELQEIDISDFRIDFGKVLPGEEVVGSLNELERKVIAWHLLHADEFQDAYFDTLEPNICICDDEEIIERLQFLKIFFDTSSELGGRFFQSVTSRFGNLGKPILYRGNFLVVTTNLSKEEIKKEIFKADMIFYKWMLGFLGRAENQQSLH